MEHYNNIVILTGAGISAESGIKTFRASDGLWEEHRVEDVATPEGFKRNPKLVHQFYNLRRAQLNSGTVQPNKAHEALARLEQELGGEVLVITQNIDDLHERAGTQHLIHMHGELNKVRCNSCGTVLRWHSDLAVDTACSKCSAVGTLRPHVVWFGEYPFSMDKIEQALQDCDLFISIGTSGHVYPAAGFVQVARAAGAHTVELNLEPSLVQSDFHESYQGKASELVPKYVDRLLKA
ncbi:MAG: Sir2 family NAD+-dependent deacetylase [Thiofilum sp.]|uniref:Sir2 family NAD+-dependent deacetylase n=1 Tax=Thiofilum sp. TaxID=2212733 RepID=UPI0025D18D8B|nr:Sir2 family NAD+-dependent deacetylase [Thiofilum sp.]MBK8454803.1 NAD-dependent protein deacylase [Thiofilum sp.]